jgi:hypothetical protein
MAFPVPSAGQHVKFVDNLPTVLTQTGWDGWMVVYSLPCIYVSFHFEYLFCKHVNKGRNEEGPTHTE